MNDFEDRMLEGKKGAVEDNSIDFLESCGTMKLHSYIPFSCFFILSLSGGKDAAYSLAKSRAVGPFVER